MDDCIQKDPSKSIKMGASSNADSAKIASLQERKKHIQDKLEKHHKELRKLCIDEAELTGQLPVEYPFEQGEMPPTFRRRIGTSFQLNKNLLNNLNNEEEITVLEMEMHMLANMAQAALGLANESSANKAAKKAHLQEYDAHVAKYKMLENKLHDLKISPTPQMFGQQKPKKKPRPEKEQGDSVSMHLNMTSDPFASSFRHSLRSLQYQSSHNLHMHAQHASGVQGLQSGQTVHGKARPVSQRYVYLVPDGVDVQSYQQAHHQLSQHKDVSTSYTAVKMEPTFYKLSLDGYKQYEEKKENLDVAVSEGHFRSYPTHGISRTLPHVSRRSPQSHGYSQAFAHTMRTSHNHTASSSISPGSSSMKYYPQMPHVRQYYDVRVPNVNANPLQLQPHQQYENVMTAGASSGSAGLGGYWKQSENGEFWCNNTSSESLKDKRFGSLDRRKKRLQKKAATASLMPPVPSYEEAIRTLPSKSQAIAVRRHENRQLVRTQSLGSVGGGDGSGSNLEANGHSDDASSCGSETANGELLRRNKQKEWYETSLDGPTVATSAPARPRTLPHLIAPPPPPAQPPPSSSSSEDKYVVDYASPSPPPTKEIPAESHPSPRGAHDRREIFASSVVPRNCTVVQQAQWKPYHEETKPFEMSDFYKYSTKYKKQAKEVTSTASSPASSTGSGFRNLPNHTTTPTRVVDANANNANVSSSSFDSNPLSPHVADNFSAEMNAWYQKHEQQSDNNNATLV